jgi:flagellar basal body-associated protein FliL
MLKAIIIILIVIAVLFVVTFGIYFFNLDMKLVRKIYDALGKHYDNLEKDRKL